MAAQKGRELVLKIHDNSAYQLIGGFRSNSFTLNGENIDITNKNSGGARELMQGGGILSMSTNGSGVFLDDAAFRTAHDKVMAQEHADCEITVPGFMTYTGMFAISSLDMSGEHNGEVTYTINLESAGPITATAIAT